MKYFLIICVLVIILICTESNSDELNNSGKSETSLETLKAKHLHTNEMLLNLEDDIKIVKKQQDKLHSDYAKMQKTIASQAEKIKKIEQIESLIKINDISRSFETTLGVLNKNVSELVKRVEDLEVRLAVFEKMYAKDQNPLETLRKVNDEQKVLIHNVEERLNRQEKKLLAMGQSPEKQKITKKSATESRKVDTREIEEMKDLKEIGEKIFVKNVELKTYGNSTNLIAEVINKSDKDYARVDLKIQLFNKADTLLSSKDLSILNLKSSGAKQINELFFGIEKESIAKYEFLTDRLKPLSIGDKKVIQTVKKKSEAAMKMTSKTQTQIKKEKPIEKIKTDIKKELSDFKKISNDLYIRNITFDKFGSSSTVKGEIKNNSRKDVTTASFILKLFGEKGSLITEFDFHIRNIKSGAIKPFEEMISGVLPSQISRYEIKHKKSL